MYANKRLKTLFEGISAKFLPFSEKIQFVEKNV